MEVSREYEGLQGCNSFARQDGLLIFVCPFDTRRRSDKSRFLGCSEFEAYLVAGWIQVPNSNFENVRGSTGRLAKKEIKRQVSRQERLEESQACSGSADGSSGGHGTLPREHTVKSLREMFQGRKKKNR